MNFWVRALVLLDVAAWGPIAAGGIARLAFFRAASHILSQEVDPSPAPDSAGFPIRDDEPQPGDPNYVPFEDHPLDGA